MKKQIRSPLEHWSPLCAYCRHHLEPAGPRALRNTEQKEHVRTGMKVEV